MPRDKSKVEIECDDIVSDLHDAYTIVSGRLASEVEELISRLPEDITTAPNTLASRIVQLQSGLSKVRMKLSYEYKQLSMYVSRFEALEKRRKLRLKNELSGVPTGKLTLKEKVDLTYDGEADYDTEDYVKMRYLFIQQCLKEMDDMRELLKSLSIQLHGARNRQNS